MEVRRTGNRFLPLLLITALGVAFFSGIRAAQPDMELSADRYYQETQLMDVSVQGSLGVTEEDVEASRLWRASGMRCPVIPWICSERGKRAAESGGHVAP